MNEESANQEKEPVTTQESDTEELDNASAEESETSGKSTEEETESGEEEEGAESQEKPKEENFEDKVTRIAQKIAAKATRTVEKQRNEWQQRALEAEDRLNDKSWNAARDDLFDEADENLREDEAKNKKTRIDKTFAEMRELRRNQNQINQVMELVGVTNPKELAELLKYSGKDGAKDIAELAAITSATRRNNIAYAELKKIFFPEDKKKVEQLEVYVKKLAKAQDPESFEMILEGIRETHKAKSKPFVPDGSKTSGSGGLDISTLPIKERVDALFAAARKKKAKR